ncbi:uncharacterized protein LOC109852943 [Pseudomyrmex gracilis]|uniref:uncharacterized protein LOC109852943 n=1 Tax=Pseudomyrmex gracilis TaxID=219809 RepID=UPI0009953A2E|nr:uncharacterized protein LOC109852943 [Pseudomyrmex gracilis]
MPPKKTLGVLLEAKLANKSVPSLVSRFSIDSKLKNDLPVDLTAPTLAAIVPLPQEDTKLSKMIKISCTKYLYSRLSPIHTMPLRAIDESYVQHVNQVLDENSREKLKSEEKREHVIKTELSKVPCDLRPELIPLGPIIRTPVLITKHLTCHDNRKQGNKFEEKKYVEKRTLCDMEKFLFKLIFPNFQSDLQLSEEKDNYEKTNEIKKKLAINVRASEVDRLSPEVIGFVKVVDEDTEIIHGSLSLLDRARVEASHFKPCYYSAILCILAKIALDVDHFSGRTLDQLILLADKINQRVGRLQYKEYRSFYDVNVLDTKYNVILKEIVRADPESSPSDELDTTIEKFLEKHQTGILVLTNCAYAFWTANDRYYLFDSYSCDEKGNASKEEYCCLMKFRDLKSMIDRIKTNSGETVNKPFRLYTVSIAHLETKKRKRKRKKTVDHHARIEKIEEEKQSVPATSPLESESSLIELAEWVTSDPELDSHRRRDVDGFMPLQHYAVSMLEASVLEDDIARPFERIFRNRTSLAISLDLCIMAWSIIHNPISWSKRTLQGLFEASVDYAYDNVLASEDTSVSGTTDAMLSEFEIANYAFRPVLAPLHYGYLYVTDGWNLATTLDKIFKSNIYTGAILVCRYAHVGIMKRENNYFAWWTISGTKNLRMIASGNISEFLKLIVKEIDEPRQIEFVVRAVTISFARKMTPDCDAMDFHETTIPRTSLLEIRRKELPEDDIKAIFRPVDRLPHFVSGTVALRDRYSLREPRAKRCYFVALLAVIVKRDVVQSPIPAMIDKVLQVAECLYREFVEPKFHSEHILLNVPLMNRVFDLRDCASSLVTLTINPRSGKNDFYTKVKRHLERYFKTNTSGIIHFSNCCYGFWHSRATNCYYYLDPYQCDTKGRRTFANGNACLCVFSFICQMAKQMCLNQHEGTTGFFIHRLHVDSINTLQFVKFQEDPMWVYLDYHWKFVHAIAKSCKKRKNKSKFDSLKTNRRFWNNYVVEVVDLIYSVWGTIGAYDCRFGERVGKNRVAICVAVLAMQHLCHPSRWSPAILDSAVICGDSYYTESLKSFTQKCSKIDNRFGLRTSFRIFPHLWTVKFGTDVCGILYGDWNQLTLAGALKLAFEEAPNVIIECNKIALSTLVAKDAYYVIDPCWIGPPLFARNRGAIYVLRCKNINALIYAITKMFNTNQRLAVRVTPVFLAFDREDTDINPEICVTSRKILPRSLRKDPGRIDDPGTIPGAVATPDESSYLSRRKYLAQSAIENFQSDECDLQPRHAEPTLSPESANNTLVSTKWRLNLGQMYFLKRSGPPLDPVEILQREKYVDSANKDCRINSRIIDRDLTDVRRYYPIPIDFVCDIPPPRIESLECLSEIGSFIREQSRTRFIESVTEMSRNTYKNYRRRLPKSKE